MRDKDRYSRHTRRLRELMKEICSLESPGNYQRQCEIKSCIYILVKAPSHLSPAKMVQYFKGRTAHRLQREFLELRKGIGETIYGVKDIFAVQLEQLQKK